MLYHPLRQKTETHTTLRDSEDLTETSARSHQWFGKLSIQKSLTLKRWRYPVVGLLATFALIAVLSTGPGNESARRRMPSQKLPYGNKRTYTKAKKLVKLTYKIGEAVEARVDKVGTWERAKVVRICKSGWAIMGYKLKFQD